MKPIKRRLVLNFPGFETIEGARLLERLDYCARKTGEIWGFETSQEFIDARDHIICAKQTSNGKTWRVETDLRQFEWHDIIGRYERGFPWRFVYNFWRYLAFFTDGTVVKYLFASNRYGAYSLFPLIFMLGFFAMGMAVAWLLLPVWPLRLLLAFAIMLLLARWVGARYYLNKTVGNWGFGRDLVLERSAQTQARIKGFASRLAAEIANADQDEIVILGHSFGAVLALGALYEALKLSPNVLDNKRLVFIAAGNSIPKIALAPKARYWREAMERVGQVKGLLWHEIQTKEDIVCFYKTDPFGLFGIKPTCQVVIDRVRFEEGMSRDYHKQMSRSAYRIHRQYVLYYDRRAPFDVMLRLFGPLSAWEMTVDPSVIERSELLP